MCLAFGVERLDDIGARSSRDVLEMQPPEGLAAKVRGLKTLKSIADSRPKIVRRGACQEIVLQRRRRRPRRGCRCRRAGRATRRRSSRCPAVITRDPRNGQRNVGMYRMQVLGPRSTAMHWQLHKDGRADYLFSEGRMEVAVALGLDPVTAYSRERAAAEAHRRAHGRRLPARRGRSSWSRASRSTSRCRRTPRSCSRATSRRASSPRRGRSATTPATTRRPSSSRSST